MIYITGDVHRDFTRFTKKKREQLPFQLTKEDYVIITGDFGLILDKKRKKETEYWCEFFQKLPFTVLFVQGNHENYDMLEEFPIEEWNGGKVRKIVQDKITLLERGQVFEIQGYKLFAFGGASCHDVLTVYFEELEQQLDYKHWYFGHYHLDKQIDIKHTVLYEKIVPLESYKDL